MRWILFALLLGGCTTAAEPSRRLPVALAGEWVSPDFKTASDDAEPDAGFALYVTGDGMALGYTAPIASVMLSASYDASAQELVLKTIAVQENEGLSITLRYGYDARAGTLTLRKSDPPGSPSDTAGLRKLKQRRAQVPPRVREIFRQRRAKGPPYT